jgi:hypothetical protein
LILMLFKGNLYLYKYSWGLFLHIYLSIYIMYYIYTYMFLSLSLSLCIGVWTQGFELARQVLYHLSHTPALYKNNLFKQSFRSDVDKQHQDTVQCFAF